MNKICVPSGEKRGYSIVVSIFTSRSLLPHLFPLTLSSLSLPCISPFIHLFRKRLQYEEGQHLHHPIPKDRCHPTCQKRADLLLGKHLYLAYRLRIKNKIKEGEEYIPCSVCGSEGERLCVVGSHVPILRREEREVVGVVIWRLSLSLL